MWRHKTAWIGFFLLAVLIIRQPVQAQTAPSPSAEPLRTETALQPVGPPVEDRSGVAPGLETINSAPITPSLEACFASLASPIVELAPCERVLSTQATGDARFSPALTSLDIAQARAVLGALYLKKLDLPRAQTSLEQAIQAAPDDIMVAGNYANLLLYQGNHQAAIESYNRLLNQLPDRYPETPALYLNRSLALRAIGRYDEASKDYQLYLQLIGAAPTAPVQFNGSDE